MTAEFQFHGAAAPDGIASSFTLEETPQPGQRVKFTDGSLWRVREIEHDIRASTNHIVVHVAPYRV